jgi:hypothetical protein
MWNLGFGWRTLGGNEIPDLRLQDVESEQIHLSGIVAPFTILSTASTETANVPAAFAMAGAFHLHAQQASALLDAHVIREIVSVGLEHVVSVEGGCGHEEELDPFSALFVGFEFLPTGVFLNFGTFMNLDSLLDHDTFLDLDIPIALA